MKWGHQRIDLWPRRNEVAQSLFGQMLQILWIICRKCSLQLSQ